MTLYFVAYLAMGAALWVVMEDRTSFNGMTISEFCETEDLNLYVLWSICCIGFALFWFPVICHAALYKLFDR